MCVCALIQCTQWKEKINEYCMMCDFRGNRAYLFQYTQANMKRKMKSALEQENCTHRFHQTSKHIRRTIQLNTMCYSTQLSTWFIITLWFYSLFRSFWNGQANQLHASFSRTLCMLHLCTDIRCNRLQFFQIILKNHSPGVWLFFHRFAFNLWFSNHMQQLQMLAEK